MEFQEDIVIVGGGIAGLSTALGLHRFGIRSIVLESSDGLRATGFALTMWTNAWRALDALGIGDVLRATSLQIQGFGFSSFNSSLPSQEQRPPESDLNSTKTELRCVRRKDLLETLESELPQQTIRYSSKLVSIEESGNFKLLHLSDGSTFRTKVLIGCDGVNSMVAKWLGLNDAINSGRSAIRGYVVYPNHGFEPKLHGYFGGGVRYGFVPCDDNTLYWFCTFSPSLFKNDENDQNPLRMKQFVLSKIKDAPEGVRDVVERTTLDCISCVPLRLRSPWNLLTGNIVKNNVCVVGDALHPMTPDLGQGGCSALEDSIVLARCLAEALLMKKDEKDEECEKTKMGLQKYSKERRWRSFSLISAAYLVGLVQESDGRVMSFLRKKFLSRFSVGIVLRMSDFDCGELIVSSET